MRLVGLGRLRRTFMEDGVLFEFEFECVALIFFPFEFECIALTLLALTLGRSNVRRYKVWYTS